MNKNKIISILGLAMRAGKISLGAPATYEALKKNKVSLVVVSTNCEGDTMRQINNKCTFYGVEIVKVLSEEELSSSIGKKNVKVIGILDEGFKHLIESEL